MEELFNALRARGWQEEGTTLHAPHRTMWLETTATWPMSVVAFLADMNSRKKRVLTMRTSVAPAEFEATLADVESAISAAEEVT